MTVWFRGDEPGTPGARTVEIDADQERAFSRGLKNGASKLPEGTRTADGAHGQRVRRIGPSFVAWEVRSVLFAFAYLLLRRVVRLFAHSSYDLNSDLEVVVLRHQLMVLRRHGQAASSSPDGTAGQASVNGIEGSPETGADLRFSGFEPMTSDFERHSAIHHDRGGDRHSRPKRSVPDSLLRPSTGMGDKGSRRPTSSFCLSPVAISH
jgi:hypothetical protein